MQRSENLAFGCVSCGDCCRGDFILALTVEEALGWAQRGGELRFAVAAFMVDAVATGSGGHSEQSATALVARCFEGRSGSVSLYLEPRLYGVVNGDCQHLTDGVCGIYADRPLVCQAYPAEIVEPADDQVFDRSSKKCPTVAWSGSSFRTNGILTHVGTHAAVSLFQATAAKDLLVLAAVARHASRRIAHLHGQITVADPMETTAIVHAIRVAMERAKSIGPSYEWEVHVDARLASGVRALGMRVYRS